MARNRNSLKERSARRLSVLAAAIAFAAGCAPSTPPQSGRAPVIISLNPCLDAMLVALAPDAGLSLSHYSRDPGSSSIPQAVAAKYAVNGGTAEEIIAASPDLVLASSFIPPTTRAALERAGLRVETFGSPTSVEESIAQVRKVARLTGREQAGENLAAAMRRALLPPADARPIATLLWQPGEIVAGDATLVAEMLRAKGYANHARAMGLDQADFVPLETVLADPPELLLVAGESAGQRHPLLARLVDTRAVALEPSLLYCGGPTVIALGRRLDAIRVESLR